MTRLLIALLCLVAALPAAAADRTPRTAIISAFEPEWTALKADLKQPREQHVAGTTFVTGTLSGQPVLLFLSGMSMVNAAMTTQLALDHYRISRILFSGIAGGIDPALDVGDVVVPDRWSQYLEATFARKSGEGFAPPEQGYHYDATLGHYGMIYPRAVQVWRDGKPERRLWFDADPALVAIARKAAASVRLTRCAANLCLRAQPKLVVGGNGISGSVFMDNAEFRSYAFQAFHAQVLDMETAAVAQVAYVNKVPFLGFRSLSDLAGGDPAENQAFTFFRIASDNSAAVVRAFLKALPPATK